MFSYKQFVRMVPAQTLRQFLESRQFTAAAKLDWSVDEADVAKAVVGLIEVAEPEERDRLISDMHEASRLADGIGDRAIRNVCRANSRIVEALAASENPAERALWLYVAHPDVFDDALEARYFDDRASLPSAKRFDLKHIGNVDRSDVARNALAGEISAFFRKREGCGKSVVVEVLDRWLEDAIQVTVYVEDLANNRPEFDHGMLKRRRSHPAKELALVYFYKTGFAETVASGGQDYHDKLATLFAKHMLGITMKPEAVKAETYKLGNLKNGVSVFDQAALGIESLRMKSLTFMPLDGGGGFLTIDAPGKDIHATADGWAAKYLPHDNPLKGAFAIVQAAIGVHFFPEAGRKRRRSLTLKFTKRGMSNLQRFGERERKMLYRFMVEWGLVAQPAAVHPPPPNPGPSGSGGHSRAAA